MRRFFGFTLLMFSAVTVHAWGGLGHRLAADLAFKTLKGPAAKVYAPLSKRIVDHVMDPDERAHLDRTERERHFLDLERFGVPVPDVTKAAATPDTSVKRRQKMLDQVRATPAEMKGSARHPGTLPLALDETYDALVAALKAKNDDDTIRYAADLLHYVTDAHQPLHATDFHDGIAGFQKGVHGAFETELLDRCADARPSKATAEPASKERPSLVALTVLLESHALAGQVLAEDLGCPTVCGKPVPKTRAQGLSCSGSGSLAKARLELAAGRTAALLTRAVEDAGRTK